MKHINVALFVPDEGCPHRCSFCNQKTISGKSRSLTVDDIEKAVVTALSSSDCGDGEIAFFGGSFTAIEREYMLSLLKKGREYVDKGLFKGIRISTRPDCIDAEILTLLKEHRVTSVELGCQSMDDGVLLLNERGHTSADVVNAAKLIKEFGFEFGVQMMTGLYGDTNEKSLETAKKLISLKPDTARIYPTVVLENTRLASLYKTGVYIPQTTDEAAELCAELLLMFHEADIRVIRLGLHSGGNVQEGFVAGAYHPAFREIAESRIYLRKIREEIQKDNLAKGKIEITVGSRYVSMASGQKKSNIDELFAHGYTAKIKGNNEYKKYEVSVRLTK
ncbi:MAG: radical SAM protein [Clostridia bacterium]|nr:radical SAM protein [Clostridia bacterium]